MNTNTPSAFWLMKSRVHVLLLGIMCSLFAALLIQVMFEQTSDPGSTELAPSDNPVRIAGNQPAALTSRMSVTCTRVKKADGSSFIVTGEARRLAATDTIPASDTVADRASLKGPILVMDRRLKD